MIRTDKVMEIFEKTKDKSFPKRILKNMTEALNNAERTELERLQNEENDRRKTEIEEKRTLKRKEREEKDLLLRKKRSDAFLAREAKSKSRKVVHRFFAFDVETTTWKETLPDKSKLKLVFCVLTEFNSHSFELINEQKFDSREIEVVLDKMIDREMHSISYIYCHNLDYDFNFLFQPFLDKREKYRVVPLLVSTRMIKVSILRRRGDGKGQYDSLCEFRNSVCLMNSSLKNIGQSLGFLKFSNDFSTIDSGRYTNEDVEYCKQDNRVVVKLLENWRNTMKQIGLVDEDLQNITLTSASCAFKLFKNLNSESIMVEGKPVRFCKYILDSKEMNDVFRPFYCGGRTEIFDFNMPINVDYYDINSLYPSVMVDLDVPVPPYYKMNGYEETAFGYECIVDESGQQIPVFPEKINGKLCFTANFQKYCFVFKEELEYLKSQGIPFKVVCSWYSHSSGKPFTYIKDLYNRRLEYRKQGNQGMANTTKIIMNSTYGRFAMKSERDVLEVEQFRLENIDAYNDYWDEYIGIIKKKEESKSQINVVIAMKITAMARLTITKEARNVVAMGKKVYYMDTDSLVVEHGAIPESKELGKFKIESKFEWFQAIGPKDYCAKEEGKTIYKTKGSRVRSFEEYKEYHEKGLLNVRPVKIKEMIQYYKQGKTNDLTPFQRNVIKQFLAVYDKRWINEDLTTKPLTYEQMYDPEGTEVKFALDMEKRRPKLREKIDRVQSEYVMQYYEYQEIPEDNETEREEKEKEMKKLQKENLALRKELRDMDEKTPVYSLVEVGLNNAQYILRVKQKIADVE